MLSTATGIGLVSWQRSRQRRDARPHPTRPRRSARSSASRPAPTSPDRSTATGSRRPDRPDPVDVLEGQADDQGARARAAALRAHAGVAVHVLPRGRCGDGRRPRRDADVRLLGPALRRRPPVQLRRLRRARPRAGPRRQRLRRDAARAVGVGRQAPGGEPRDRRPRPRLQRRRSGEAVVLAGA